MGKFNIHGSRGPDRPPKAFILPQVCSESSAMDCSPPAPLECGPKLCVGSQVTGTDHAYPISEDTAFPPDVPELQGREAEVGVGKVNHKKLSCPWRPGQRV